MAYGFPRRNAGASLKLVRVCWRRARRCGFPPQKCGGLIEARKEAAIMGRVLKSFPRRNAGASLKLHG